MVNKRIAFDIDIDLYNKLKDYAVKEQRSVCNTIRLILELALEIALNKNKSSVDNVENIVTQSVVNVETNIVNNGVVSTNGTSKRLPRYEISDKSILNQYRIDNTYNLNFSEIRQLTKLHKGILEQKHNGYSVINNFCFENVDLSNRNLTNIKLRQGNLRGANFKNSNLTNCDFSKTMLWGVDFTGANLENAKFDIIYLGKYQGKDTNFTGANLKGTILENNNN